MWLMSSILRAISPEFLCSAAAWEMWVLIWLISVKAWISSIALWHSMLVVPTCPYPPYSFSKVTLLAVFELDCRLLIMVSISAVGATDFPANTRTSSATTAKPRPCSPARAASIAAFSASRFKSVLQCRELRLEVEPSCGSHLLQFTHRTYRLG